MDDKSIEMTSVEKMDYNAVLFRQTSRLQHQVLRHLCTWIVHTDVEKKTSNSNPSKQNNNQSQEIHPPLGFFQSHL